MLEARSPELTTDGIWNYSYDAEGNLIQAVRIANGETWTYGYDLRNRLTSAQDKLADGTLVLSAAYRYDALDRFEQPR